ncbi:MAG: type II toxin-antitoxin system VapC family toxin, partial [Candidatus Bathyarchaeia archaeon]
MSGVERIVVDASVVVKWFVQEEGSEEALVIRRKYIEGEAEIIAPELLLFETLNALRYKGLFTEPEIKRIAESLDAYAFNLHSLRGEYAAQAIQVAFENNITIYDSSYVSLAVREAGQMYTGDQELIQKLREPYLRVVKNIRGARE